MISSYWCDATLDMCRLSYMFLEVIKNATPGGILMFITIYQLSIPCHLYNGWDQNVFLEKTTLLCSYLSLKIMVYQRTVNGFLRFDASIMFIKLAFALLFFEWYIKIRADDWDVDISLDTLQKEQYPYVY